MARQKSSKQAVPAFCRTLIYLLVSAQAWAQGRVDCSRVTSHILGRSVGYCVLIPASYQAPGGRRYPVLYFLHGLGENQRALLDSGGWGLIEDLREEGRIGEFLMVAPEGGGSFFINSADGRDRYSDFFLSEFLPQIETRYRVLRRRAARGITGLSMGGYGALRLAFTYPRLFGSVSAQSPALVTLPPRAINRELPQTLPLWNLLAPVFGNPIDVAHWNGNNPLRLAERNRIELHDQLIYFNCGDHDEYGFEKGAAELDRILEKNKVRHEFHLYPGGHTSAYFLSHLGETVELHWRAFARESGDVR
jgi:enterochelin esterase-like enzyme